MFSLTGADVTGVGPRLRQQVQKHVAQESTQGKAEQLLQAPGSSCEAETSATKLAHLTGFLDCKLPKAGFGLLLFWVSTSHRPSRGRVLRGSTVDYGIIVDSLTTIG